MDLNKGNIQNVSFNLILAKGKIFKGSIVQAMKKNEDNIKLNEIMVDFIYIRESLKRKMR